MHSADFYLPKSGIEIGRNSPSFEHWFPQFLTSFPFYFGFLSPLRNKIVKGVDYKK